jgi:hypothetical protein
MSLSCYWWCHPASQWRCHRQVFLSWRHQVCFVMSKHRVGKSFEIPQIRQRFTQECWNRWWFLCQSMTIMKVPGGDFSTIKLLRVQSFGWTWEQFHKIFTQRTSVSVSVSSGSQSRTAQTEAWAGDTGSPGSDVVVVTSAGDSWLNGGHVLSVGWCGGGGDTEREGERERGKVRERETRRPSFFLF